MFIESDYEFIIGASYTFKDINHIGLMSKMGIENAEHRNIKCIIYHKFHSINLKA
jgi:hypothetical protein